MSTHQVREEGRNRPPDLPLAPHEDRVGLAHELLPGVLAEVAHRANHVVEPHEEGAPGDAESHRAEERAHKALDRLLGRKLDQRRLAKGDAANVREDVVADDEGCRDPEPDDALQDVVDDKVAEHVVNILYDLTTMALTWKRPQGASSYAPSRRDRIAA